MSDVLIYVNFHAAAGSGTVRAGQWLVRPTNTQQDHFIAKNLARSAKHSTIQTGITIKPVVTMVRPRALSHPVL